MITSMHRLLATACFTAVFILSNGASAQSIKWEPEFRFPGTFFPAFAISAAGTDSTGPVDIPQAYGFLGSGQLGVRVTQVSTGSRLKVEIEIAEIGVSGEIETQVPGDGKPKYIIPRLSWSESKLAAIDQPISSEAVFRVYVDGLRVGEERRHVRVRAINDVPTRVCLAQQSCKDYSMYMAAFVNENHPVIDNVLRAALDIPAMPVKAWSGTQGSEEEVLRQVWAIWYLFQRNKVTYSSITTVSDTRQDIMSQTVRPITQSLRTSQANCIDGTVLFASILRKIGIEPRIVLIPGHAFLSFFTDFQQRKPVFLETTMLNDATNPFNQRGPTKVGIAFSKFTGTDVHMQESWQSFVDALNEGSQKYRQAAPNFGKQPGFMIIPIAQARKDGILPLPL